MSVPVVDPWLVWTRLDKVQRTRLEQFERELARINARHNLISRASAKDIRRRHTLHCLALACKTFSADATVVDWGTGGGLPAIPLAVAFPSVSVIAVDASLKKVLAVRRLARLLQLTNVAVWVGQASEWRGHADYSVSRAAASLVSLWEWHVRVANSGSSASQDGIWRAGLVCLKGGDLKAETQSLEEKHPHLDVQVTKIDDSTGTWKGKRIVHVCRS